MADSASEAKETGAVVLEPSAQALLKRQKRSQRINNEHYFRMHPELRQMVAAFTSALLADKPEDVHLYAEQFFTNPELAHSLGLQGWSRPQTPQVENLEEEEEFYEEELNPEISGATDMDTVDLENLLIDLFKEADKDQNGTLDADEFASLMNTASLGLKKSELKQILSETDENNDGTISYQEFVPLAVEVVQMMRLKQKYEEYEEDVGEELRYAAMTILGVTPEELASMLAQAVDKLGSGGFMSKAQLKAFLKRPDLGLSKQQANGAAAEVQYDAEGRVSLDVLVSDRLGLYDILVQELARYLQQQDLGEVGEELSRIFLHYDKDDTGFLDRHQMTTALNVGYPFMTKLQIHSLTSAADAPRNDAGQLAWKEYLPKLTTCIKAMIDPEAIRERGELAMRAEFQPVQMMSHLDRAKFDDNITSLFHESDADHSGTLNGVEFRDLMAKTDFGLTGGEINGLMDVFDMDENRVLSLDEFLSMAYDTLANLARERAIMSALGGAFD